MEKLTITPYQWNDQNQELVESKQLQPVQVLFNPTTYSISKTFSWQPISQPEPKEGEDSQQRGYNAPALEPAGGGSRSFSCELFFDMTEPSEEGWAANDVRTETNKIYQLALIEPKTQSPPICQLTWGQDIGGPGFEFKGVLTNLTQNFVLFADNGNPLRAKLQVSFTEWIEPKEDRQKTDPELTTHLLRQGETLSAIAAKEYQNPRQWRLIAEANNIDDPRNLTVGQRLIIPKFAGAQ